MAFTIEVGSGTPNANAYVTPTFVTTYLTDRNRETENLWSTIGTTLQQTAIVAGTDFIEKRWRTLFKGTPFIIEIAGRIAAGTIQFTANPLEGELVTVGTKAFKFTATLTDENDVLIASTLAESLTNLVAAASGGDTAGTNYQEFTRQSFVATLFIDDDDDTLLNVSAFITGENGNEIVLTTTVTGATASNATLIGGIDTAAQPLSFPRTGLFTPRGEEVLGIPLRLKQSTAEYSVRSLAAILSPDPDIDDSLVSVKSRTDIVGPIEETREFVQGAVPQVFKSYPAADELLAEYVLPPGGTFR